jgi:anhydro-N-acetylmuramic acid kinase
MVSKNIEKLYRAASKESRLIIGLMSGTSLDGLDIALCKISGHGLDTKLRLLRFTTVPYSKGFKDRVKEVFAKPQISFMALTELNSLIGLVHGRMILKTLKKWRIKTYKIDAIASHGQTVFHSPKHASPKATINSTFQAGDGDHLAVTTGIITISDFRQKHIAAGGEGAPLAAYGDYILYSKKGENRIMLNIGGIANFTFLPASGDPKKIVVTDVGPGNTLLDQTVQYIVPNQYFDQDAKLAMNGEVHFPLLKILKSDPFFKRPFPKTTGPELFNLHYLRSAVERSGEMQMEVEDVLATLTRFTAETIAEAILKIKTKKKKHNIFISGGGAFNPLLMKFLKELLPQVTFRSIMELGLSADSKEAVLFAVLANETLCGEYIPFGPKMPSVMMGKISFPK